MLSRHRRSKPIVVPETPSEVVSSGGSGNRRCCTSSSSASSDPSTSSHVGKSERHSILQELRTSKEYLLQACLKYDWRTVERICLVLITYFERRQQQRRRQHYGTSRAQLTALDPWGNTPLHAACYFRPTQNVIKLLLQAARLYDVPLSTSINEKGATPLVIACSAGSSTHIIQQLLEASASSSSNGGVATMVSFVDNDSTTPFVALARRYQMLRRIPRYSKVTLPLEQITKETMGMEEEQDAYNNNSISSSDGSFLDSSTRSNSSSSSSSDTTVTTTTLPPHNGYGYFDNDNDEENDLQTGFDSQKLFHTLWKKMNAIIQATWFADHINNNSNNNNSNNNNTTIRKSLPLRLEFHSILHGAAYVSDLLPPVMSSLLIRCHEELVSLNNDKNTTTTTTTNNNGILPLHLAVTVDSASSCCYNNPTLLEQRTFFIEQLLKVDPTTAMCPIPTNGRLPLMEAIASGLPWHCLVLDDSATTTRTPSNKTLRTTTCHEDEEEDSTTTSTCTISDTDDSSDEDDDEDEEEESSTSDVQRKQQKQPPPQKGPLQFLWDAAPDAMNHKDPVTGLRPFMLAAASAVTTQNTTKDDNGSTTGGGGGAEELQQLDTIFALLKLDPSSVQCD